MDFQKLSQQLDGLETKLTALGTQADGQLKTVGKVADDTAAAITKLGAEQKALADRLLQLEQSGAAPGGAAQQDDWGNQFVKSASYQSFVAGATQKASWEVKNTITNTVGNTFSDRKPGVVGGAFRRLRIEALLASLPTTSNSIEYVREATFTNASAETTEGNVKPETTITTSLQTMPVATVAHIIKISRQLAADNAAMAAYVNLRMRYGVDLRVENQLIAGNGTTPNISGMATSGNNTAHGYTAASLTGLGLLNNRFDLIGKMIGDCELADFPADVVMLNPTDWWTMRLTKDSQARYLLGDPGQMVAATLFGVPVVTSSAVVADTVFVGSLSQAATLHTREGTTIAMSESDGDNFQRNLITVRAERRAALTVERPAALRYGDLTPA